MPSRFHPERLAQAIAERVVSLVVEALDIDALVRRIDVNALLDQVDVERLLDRVDLEALLDRIDLDALLARTDLAAMVSSATRGTADDALEALRGRAARADDVVSGWADRLVGRA
ncbi:MAG TPA: hypothetical protein VK611_14235 [Acidimicrobiales bacterium]|nr:hypothetical protein [Acidimicrobiales bacterium]